MNYNNHFAWRDELIDYFYLTKNKTPCSVCKRYSCGKFCELRFAINNREETMEKIKAEGWSHNNGQTEIIPSADAVNQYIVNYVDPVTCYNHYVSFCTFDTSCLTDDFVKFCEKRIQPSFVFTDKLLGDYCIKFLTMLKYHYQAMTFFPSKGKLMKGYDYGGNDKLFNSLIDRIGSGYFAPNTFSHLIVKNYYN